MADFGNEALGVGVNLAAQRGIGTVTGPSPVPIPSFYNANDPNHPFANSQAMQMLQGNGAAWNRYGHQALARGADLALDGAFPPAGLLNHGITAVGSLFGKQWGLGNWVFNRQDDRQPTGTVGGTPATTTGNQTTAGDVSIDPWTGQPTTGQAAQESPWMNSDTGPYASGYQGLPAQPSQPAPTLPDFSNYSDQYTNQSAAPSQGGGGDSGGGDMSRMGNGNGGAWLTGGGFSGVMNGAGNQTLAEFSQAGGNGDPMFMISRFMGMEGKPKPGAAER